MTYRKEIEKALPLLDSGDLEQACRIIQRVAGQIQGKLTRDKQAGFGLSTFVRDLQGHGLGTHFANTMRNSFGYLTVHQLLKLPNRVIRARGFGVGPAMMDVVEELRGRFNVSPIPMFWEEYTHNGKAERRLLDVICYVQATDKAILYDATT